MQVVSITTLSPSLRNNFSCGVEGLDHFFRNYAKQNDPKGLGKTYVLIVENVPVGYYTINMSCIKHDSLPLSHAKHMPKYPIGVGHISKLATDLRHRRKGYGEHLLFHAIDIIEKAAETLGAYAVSVDAKDQKAKEFYLKYGFIPFQDKPLSLFLPLEKALF